MTPRGVGLTPWLRWLAGLVLWAVLSVLSWQIPPLQSPDELQHLGRAASLAGGHWTLRQQDGAPAHAVMDSSMERLAAPYMAIAVQADRRLSAQERQEMESLAWSGRPTAVVLPGVAYYMPLIYAPAAFGLAAGRAAGLGVLDSYRLAKATSVGMVLLLLAAALRCWQPPSLAWALLLLPMSLYQAASPVPDGLANALTLLALSLFMRAWLDAGQGGYDRLAGTAAALAAVLLVLLGCRPHMLPLLALPWWLGLLARGGRHAWPVLGAALAVTLLSVGWWAHALSTTVDPRVQRSVGTLEIAQGYASQPAALWEVMHRTLSDPLILAFYRDSFIGKLGWLDTLLPAWAYDVLPVGILALLGLGLASWWTKRSGGIGGAGLRSDAARGLVLTGLGLACLALIFLAMLLTWSKHPAQIIEGVQGRYFLGPALVLAVAWAAGRPAAIARPWRIAGWTICATQGLLSAVALAQAVAIRYH